MKLSELYYIDSFEFSHFPLTEKHIQGYKIYYEKPKYLLKDDDLFLIYSFSNKWKSYNLGWFKKQDENNKKNIEFIKDQEIKKQYFNKNFILVSNLTLVKKNKGYIVEVVLVDQKYKGQRLGQKMYYYFLKYIDSPIISDSKLTNDGKKLWIGFYKSNIFEVKAINLKTNDIMDIEVKNDEFYIKSSNISLLDLNKEDINNKENIRLLLSLK